MLGLVGFLWFVPSLNCGLCPYYSLNLWFMSLFLWKWFIAIYICFLSYTSGNDMQNYRIAIQIHVVILPILLVMKIQTYVYIECGAPQIAKLWLMGFINQRTMWGAPHCRIISMFFCLFFSQIFFFFISMAVQCKKTKYVYIVFGLFIYLGVLQILRYRILGLYWEYNGN